MRQNIMAAVAEGVRQAVVQSVQSQVENNELQKSSDLEFAIRNAIRLAVERSVEQALQSTTSDTSVKMTEQMTTEMELIERQIQAAVIQAVRRSLQTCRLRPPLRAGHCSQLSGSQCCRLCRPRSPELWTWPRSGGISSRQYGPRWRPPSPGGYSRVLAPAVGRQ